MVARINTGKSISKALNYNEKKVQQENAECLHAQNFLKDAADMNFYEKRRTFEKLTSLNERAQTNMVHISLNFDPSEKLTKEKLVAIAGGYMEKIGFKDQPYIIYQHNDSGHAHIHIVSTNIKSDGSRISMHNMGRNQSELARKPIEQEFNLVKAESRKQEKADALTPVNAQRLNHGKHTTKAAISNVLRTVIPQYKYASLPELNAILKLYNIRADRCGENSDTYKHKGLLFRALDEKGNMVGTPIKASRFYMKPTLKNLEKRFEENKLLKLPYSQRLKTNIDYAFKRNPGISLQKLEADLKKEGISIIIRQNKEGLVYGMTYIDHKTKTVFNGSDLGRQYSAKAILERCESNTTKELINADLKAKKSQRTDVHSSDSKGQFEHTPFEIPSTAAEFKILDTLFRSETGGDTVPYPLKKSKQKRKRRRLRL